MVPERVVRDLAQPVRSLSGAAGAADLHAAITRLLRDFSVEQTPAELARRSAFPAALPAGTHVYVTWIPGAASARTVAAAARVRELGMTPVPHLAARAVEDAAALERLLLELHREAGVEHLLLIAGSQRDPAGVFADALQLLATGLFDGAPWRSLGFAAHPEGSPAIDAAALAHALAQKNAHAAATPVPHRLVTQFAFAGEPVVAWERQVRAAGNRLPVRVGLAGLASLPTLLRYAASCGVGSSTRALLHHGARAIRLAGSVAPGRIVAAVAHATLADAATSFQGLHFYPFGSLDRTVDWAAAIAAGAFTLDAEGEDLVV